MKEFNDSRNWLELINEITGITQCLFHHSAQEQHRRCPSSNHRNQFNKIFGITEQHVYRPKQQAKSKTKEHQNDESDNTGADLNRRGLPSREQNSNHEDDHLGKEMNRTDPN